MKQFFYIGRCLRMARQQTCQRCQKRELTSLSFTMPQTNTQRHLKQYKHVLSSGCSKFYSDDHKYYDTLNGSSSALQLLNSTLSHLLRNNAEPDLIARSICSIQTAHYTDLWVSLPWLQKNRNIAFIQLLLNGELNQFTAPIRQHDTFTLLYSLTEQHLEGIQPDLIPKMCLAYLHLGIQTTDPLIYKILCSIRESLHEVSAKGLGCVSQAISALPRLDTITHRILCKRLKYFIDNGASFDADALRGMCLTLVNSNQFISKDIYRRLIGILLEHKDSFFECPDNIGLCLRVLRKAFHMFKYTPEERKIVEQIHHLINYIKMSCFECMDDMECNNIAEICHSLKNCHSYRGAIVSSFQDRGMTLLQSTDRLSDISNILYCVTKQMDSEDKTLVQNAVMSKLDSDLHDVVLISNFAETLRELGYIEKPLLDLFHDVISKNTDNIIAYITRFTKVSKFLSKKRFTNPVQERRFIEALTTHLDRQHGFTSSTISEMSTLLLQCSRYCIPELFYGKLLSAIPQWKEGQIYRLSASLNSVRKPLSTKMRLQIEVIQQSLQENLMERIDNINTFDYLYQLTLGLVIHNQSRRNPSFTDLLMNKYLMFSENLTDNALLRCAEIFQSIKYLLPEVLDNLADNVVRRADKIGSSKTATVLATLATVGYLPENSDMFILACLDAFEDFHESRSYEEMLSVLLNLIHLSYQPDEELMKVFNFDFVEELDNHIAGGKRAASVSRLRSLMMQLNRAVVLECPQLDVPWFHEQYCLEQIVKDEPQDSVMVSRFRDDVEQALKDALGSEDNVRRWVYTPYFYSIDFECILDSSQRPINVTEVSRTGVSRSCQRVAIVIQPERDFCYGRRDLDGRNQTKLRHLEMLGYRVVEVPHFEWYSVDLADWQGKTEYLHNKIFD